MSAQAQAETEDAEAGVEAEAEAEAEDAEAGVEVEAEAEAGSAAVEARWPSSSRAH